MTKPTQRELYIFRHAKSDWDSGASSDFERPLANRGKKDAPVMGKWMKRQNLLPDYIVSSPAKRAKQTVKAVIKELGVSENKIHFNETIYMASVQTLLQVLAGVPQEAERVMIVGHNPGLDELLLYLVNAPPMTDSGKLMTTACLALVALPPDWSHLPKHCGVLTNITRPKELSED